MSIEKKLGYMTSLEMLSAALILLMIYVLPEAQVSSYRLWEIFPAFVAASITTFGLKTMKKET